MRGTRALAAGGCAVALLLTGCAAGTEPVKPVAAAAAESTAAPSTEADDASMGADAPADPSAAADLGLPTEEPDDPSAPPVAEERLAPKTVVPRRALLDAETVASVAGGAWTAGGEPDRCAAPAPRGALAVRSSVLDSAGGRLVQTVATHHDAAAAQRAVPRLASRLKACGWASAEDLMLGEVGASLTRSGPSGRETAIVLALEGVSITQVGSGSAAEENTWAALADLALGSSCPAAPDGCH